MENPIFQNNRPLTDDELLLRFFDEHRQQLPDDGFSERVARQLPRRSLRLRRLWTLACTAIGIVFFVWADGLGQLRHVLRNALGNFLGFLSSVDPLGNIASPLVLLCALALIAVFAAWNLADRRWYL